jgi:hypothetical protein
VIRAPGALQQLKNGIDSELYGL